jgi:hypothetical protein
MSLATYFGTLQKIFLAYITRWVSCGYAKSSASKSSFSFTRFSDFKGFTHYQAKKAPVEGKETTMKTNPLHPGAAGHC